MHEDEMLLVSTPTKCANYLKGKRVGEVIPGRVGAISAYPGANIRVVNVAEQELGEDLDSLDLTEIGNSIAIN